MTPPLHAPPPMHGRPDNQLMSYSAPQLHMGEDMQAMPCTLSQPQFIPMETDSFFSLQQLSMDFSAVLPPVQDPSHLAPFIKSPDQFSVSPSSRSSMHWGGVVNTIEPVRHSFVWSCYLPESIIVGDLLATSTYQQRWIQTLHPEGHQICVLEQRTLGQPIY